MKSTKTKLAMCAGIAALLSLSATASATIREAAQLIVMDGTPGDTYHDCSWNPIYAYGEVYSTRTTPGRVVCQAYSFQANVWGWSTGDCSLGDYQRVSVRTSTSEFCSGPWVTFIDNNESFTYCDVDTIADDGSSCSSRQYYGFGESTSQSW